VVPKTMRKVLLLVTNWASLCSLPVSVTLGINREREGKKLISRST